jgi:hypothetical protein
MNNTSESGGFFNTLKRNASKLAETVTGAVNSAGKMISGKSEGANSSTGNASITSGMMGGKRKSRNMKRKSKKTRKNMKQRKH